MVICKTTAKGGLVQRLALGKAGHLAVVVVKPLKSLQFVGIVKLPIAAQFLPNVCYQLAFICHSYNDCTDL